MITAAQQAELGLAAPRIDGSVLADDAVNARKRLPSHAAKGIDSQDLLAGEPASTNTHTVQAL